MTRASIGSCCLAVLLGCGSSGCSSSGKWTPADTTSATHAVQLSQRCEALCLSDAGCSPLVAAGCLEAVGCNVGSQLHRHGAPDLDAGQGCAP